MRHQSQSLDQKRSTAHRHAAVGVALLAVLALLLEGPALSPASAEPAGTAHAYAPDPTGVFANPERGFYSDIEKFQTLDSQTAARFRSKEGPDLSLVHGLVDLSDYTSRDLDQPLLDGLSSAFAALRANGLKVVLRFTYSPSVPSGAPTACNREVAPPVYPAPGGVPPDAPLDIVRQQLHTVSPLLQQNVDVIAAFEAGFAGEWGEWHCSTNLLLSKANIGQLVTALMTELPSSRQVALRYPVDVLAFAPDNPRIGNHQDCYAASANDSGTWSSDPAEMAQQMQEIGALGEHTIIGGTACSRSSRTTCTIAALGTPTKQSELAEMHFSFLMYPFNANALAAYSIEPQDPAGQDCLQPTAAGPSIQRQLGYRFELTQATFADAAVPGQSLDVSVTLTNQGWASPYNQRPVLLVLDGPSGRTEAPVQADPRTWESGQTTTISSSIPVPADAAGTYRLALWLPDQALGLRSASVVGDYSVRFANLGTWDQATGFNVLSTAVYVQSSTTTTSSTSSSSTSSTSSSTTSSTSSGTTTVGPSSGPATTSADWSATTSRASGAVPAPSRPSPDVPPAAPVASGPLAATGFSPWPAVLGGLLVVTGTALLLAARRRVSRGR